MNLLQAQQTDWSWLPQMGEIALAILGIIVIAVYFIRGGLPKVLEHRLKTAEINAQSGKTILTDEIKGWLNRVENTIKDEARKRIKRQAEVDERLDQLEAVIVDSKMASEAISQGTLENMLFNEGLAVSRRLQAFRKLIAMGKNGRVKEKGFKLILNNKETWKDIESTELGIEVYDRGYFEGVMEKANKLVFELSV